MSGKKWPRLWLSMGAAMLAACAWMQVSAQTPQATPSIGITPRAAALDAPRELTLQGLSPSQLVSGALFDPFGGERDLEGQADESGTARYSLTPPHGGWDAGLYRVAFTTGGGHSLSATFIASDGQPHLLQSETLPSPFSAFHIEGTGLSPQTALNLTLYLPGGLGQRTFRVTTDADGSLELFIWPQMLGYTFFSAGGYRLTAPAGGVEADWIVREHPVSSTITVKGPVLPGAPLQLSFDSYTPLRPLWVVYATADGTPVGNALVGPTDVRGHADAALALPALAPGTYLIATPYDWGETTFTVPAPTPTNTPTATPTPTRTPTPAPTSTPTATPVPCFLSLKLAHRTVRVGKEQAVMVTTLPNAALDLTVQFPTRNRKHRRGAADRGGSYTWTFMQPANRTTRTSARARVLVTATCSDGSLVQAHRTYRIH